MNALMCPSLCIKVAICSSGEEIQTENFKIYTINEIIKQTQKY